MIHKLTTTTLSILFLLPLFTFGTTEAQAAWLWSPETGEWTNTKSVPKDTPEEQFNFGKVKYDQEDYKRALDEFNKVIRNYPNSRWAAEAQYYIGQTHEKLDDIGKATDSYRTLVDRYPYSDRLNSAIEREFQLAEAMRGGEKTKIWGMAIMPAEDTAIELYRHIVRSAPYGPYGALSQYRIGDALLALGNYDEAQEAYQAVIDEYPSSQYASEAKYKIAQVAHQSAIKQEYRLERTDEAIKNYEKFKKAYPESNLGVEANEAIKELREKRAEDIYDIADFYRRRKRFPSARIYYKEVAAKFPDTQIAEQSRAHLEEINAIIAGQKEAKPKPFLGILPIDDDSRPYDEVEKQEGKQERFLGIFPVGKKEDKKSEPVVEKKEEKQERFLGIFPVGKKEEEKTEPVVEEKAEEKQDMFLGIFPIGKKSDEKVHEMETQSTQEPSEEEQPKKKFLGLF